MLTIKMIKASNDRYQANLLVIGIFIFFLIEHLVRSLPKDIANGLYTWVLTDWLIDYSTGFVRRGLAGEIMGFFSRFAHPQTVLVIFTWALFLASVTGLIWLILRSKNLLQPLWVFGALFFPTFLPFFIFDHAAFGRKELVGFPILLFHLYILKRYKHTQQENIQKYLIFLPILTVFLLPIHILIHESAFLLFVPIHLVLTFSYLSSNPTPKFRRRLLTGSVLYLPVLLTFLAVIFLGQVSLQDAQSICHRWESIGILTKNSCRVVSGLFVEETAGSFKALSWSIPRALLKTKRTLSKDVLFWVINIPVLGLPALYICTRIIVSLQKKILPKELNQSKIIQNTHNMVSKYFFLPLQMMIPIFILGVDYGRWFTVAAVNFLFVSLSQEVNDLENHNQPGIMASLPRINFYLLGAGLIILGIWADLFDLSNPGFSRTQFLTILGGWIIILGGILIHRLGFLLKIINNFEKRKFSYYADLLILLVLTFFIRLPHCCHQGHNMLAETVQSLFK